MESQNLDHIEDKEPETKSAIGVAGSTAEEEECNSRTDTNDFERPGTLGQGGDSSDDHVIDVDHGNNGDHSREEKVCRICHLSTEPSSGASGLMQLGCHCRAELAISHPHCAETWFKQRGNRMCEICGSMAKNVKFVKSYNSRMIIVDFDDRRMRPATPYSSPEEGSQCCKQSCCNVLLACLVLGLVVPWFFRASLFQGR